MPRHSEESPPPAPRRKGRARQGAGKGASRSGAAAGARAASGKSGSRSKGRRKKESGEATGTGRSRTSRSGSRTSRSGARQFHGPSLFDALTRRNGILLWFAALLLLVAVIAYPVADHATRTLTVSLLLGLVLGGIALCWRYSLLRWSLLALLLLLVGYWFLPGRTSFDRPVLREEAAAALQRYAGTRYWPDGENRWGVDGPGLIRRSMIEATFCHGWRTLNPWLLRRSWTFWWSDLSARELLPSAKGSARRYTIAKSVKDLNPAVLYPGDFLVTQDRKYVLAYLGEERWLLPDAESGQVIMLDGRTSTHPATQQPVSLMRWKILEAPRPNSMYLP